MFSVRKERLQCLPILIINPHVDVEDVLSCEHTAIVIEILSIVTTNKLALATFSTILCNFKLLNKNAI